jgi:hypothetical protein
MCTNYLVECKVLTFIPYYLGQSTYDFITLCLWKENHDEDAYLCGKKYFSHTWLKVF